MLAHYVPASMAVDPSTANIAVLDNPDPLDIVNSKDLMPQARKIDIDVSYAKRLSLWAFTPNVLEYELGYLASNQSDPKMPRYDGK